MMESAELRRVLAAKESKRSEEERYGRITKKPQYAHSLLREPRDERSSSTARKKSEGLTLES